MSLWPLLDKQQHTNTHTHAAGACGEGGDRIAVGTSALAPPPSSSLVAHPCALFLWGGMLNFQKFSSFLIVDKPSSACRILTLRVSYKIEKLIVTTAIFSEI